MRNQLTNPRGNIILLALFVLFASSLIGLLISMMMRGFLRYSEDIASYQKASYLAKAGAEVWFLLTNTTKANFDYTLGKEDKENILNNFTCKREKEENWICPDFNLNLQITWLWNSDQNNTLTLEEWKNGITSNTNSYFILSNTSETTVQICPSWENIPQENIKILSTATFRDKTIWKEYLSTQKLPDFLKSDNYLAIK